MSANRRVAARALGALSTAALLAGALTCAAPATAVVRADDRPETTWMVDGPVYASAVAGDTVYLGGRFSNAVSSTGDTFPRNGLAAFSLSSGKPLPWNPGTNGTVWALETDGSSIWAGGDFTRIGGKETERIARLSPNGAVDSRFRVGVNNTVRALELSGGMLYVGGLFTSTDGCRDRKGRGGHLIKVNATSGAVAQGFDPVVDTNVRAIVAPKQGSDIYVAGNFRKVNGEARSRVARINGGSGKLSPVTFAKPEKATVRALDLSPDGTLLYGGVGGSYNSAVAWSTSTGKQIFRHQVVGDVHSVKYHQGSLWMGFADGALDDPTARVRSIDAFNGATEPGFAPRVNSAWGVRTIAATDQGIAIAGNFTRVAGEVHRYLAFFGADLTAATEYVGGRTWWRFDDRSTHTDAWTASTYGDGRWAKGLPQFGFGDGDETTAINGGTTEAPRVTAYYRTTFSVSTLPTALTLRLAADDGAVVYLNGVEVLRDNMPEGEILPETLATTFRNGAGEDWLRTFELDPAQLRVGANTLAVEVHQAKGGLTDGSFDARLIGR